MNFSCQKCNYSTTDKSNWKKHLKTTKHRKKRKPREPRAPTLPDNNQQTQNHAKIKKMKKKSSSNEEEMEQGEKQQVHVCEYCNCTFTRICSYISHLRKCPVYEHFKTQSKMYYEIAAKDLKIDVLNKAVDIYSESTNKSIDTAKSATRASDKAISAMSYIMAKFESAPPLEPIEDKKIESILYNGGIGDMDRDPADIDDPLGHLSTPDDIFSMYQSGKLVPYIGDCIIRIYKTIDPADRSIWASDCRRLSYVVKSHISNYKNKNSKWRADKKGLEISKMIIDPILAELKAIVIGRKRYGVDTGTTNEGQLSMDRMCEMMDLIGDIHGGVLSTKILRYIASDFYLDKAAVDEYIENHDILSTESDY